MLKGIKKTTTTKPNDSSNNNQQNPQTVEIVNQQHSDLKHPQIKTIVQQKQQYQILTMQLQQKNQQIMEAFVCGKQLDVLAGLEMLRKQEREYYQVAEKALNQEKIIKQNKTKDEKKSSKFQYQIDFGDQQDQKNKKKKKRNKKPTIPTSIRKVAACKLCPEENPALFPLSTSPLAYLSFQTYKVFPKLPHFIISPIQHQQCRPGIDQQTENQLRNYQKCLTMYLQKQNLHTIFIQQFYQKNQHMSIEVVGIPLNKAYDLPLFFKQSLQSSSTNWRTHSNIIEIKKQKGGIRKQVPKQMNYFYIDFGLGYGYAHVIQDERNWDYRLAYEVIAAAVNVDQLQVRTTLEYETQELEDMAEKFQGKWKLYDWTTAL